MENNQKYCKHCGELIDKDCVVCPKCGKQVEDLTSAHDKNIIINNSASSSSSATVPEKTAKEITLVFKMALDIHSWAVNRRYILDYRIYSQSKLEIQKLI